jgi:hypothetical protein
MNDNQDIRIIDYIRVIFGVIIFLAATGWLVVGLLLNHAYEGSFFSYIFIVAIWIAAMCLSWWLVFRSRWKAGPWLLGIPVIIVCVIAATASIDF